MADPDPSETAKAIAPPPPKPRIVLDYETPDKESADLYRNWGICGFILSLLVIPIWLAGVFTFVAGMAGGVISLMGIFLSISALMGMRQSRVSKGMGYAIAGLIIGVLLPPLMIVLWLLFYPASR